jgi:hypothetical protein
MLTILGCLPIRKDENRAIIVVYIHTVYIVFDPFASVMHGRTSVSDLNGNDCT